MTVLPGTPFRSDLALIPAAGRLLISNFGSGLIQDSGSTLLSRVYLSKAKSAEPWHLGLDLLSMSDMET